MPDDIEQIAAGHPSLLASAHVPITEASRMSGFDVDSLLLQAVEGKLELFYLTASVDGFLKNPDDLEHEGEPPRN